MTDEEKPEEKAPEWEYRTNLGINERMKDVIKKTLEAARAERDLLLKKLRKAQYGK